MFKINFLFLLTLQNMSDRCECMFATSWLVVNFPNVAGYKSRSVNCASLKNNPKLLARPIIHNYLITTADRNFKKRVYTLSIASAKEFAARSNSNNTFTTPLVQYLIFKKAPYDDFYGHWKKYSDMHDGSPKEKRAKRFSSLCQVDAQYLCPKQVLISICMQIADGCIKKSLAC